MLKGRFSQYDSQDLNRLAAKGILEKLRNIRQRINVEFTARRLIWELIQNAKDNAAICNIDNNSDVNITIELKENQLIFSHDKGYFTNENVRGLIRRYSSSEKDRKYDQPSETPSTTGRFGTGFMTTHLLSEKVFTKGVFLDEDFKYRRFELPLDRSGQDESSIIDSIESSFNSVEASIEKAQDINLSEKDKFKTEFIYSLNNSENRIAEISISELRMTYAYTLINIPSIKKITVRTNGTTNDYAVNQLNSVDLDGDHLTFFEVKTNDSNVLQRYFARITKQDTSIVVPLTKKENGFDIERLPEELPRLFLDFPLTGTEEMNIPFVINSPLFEPTDSRNGVSLTGGDDKDTRTNSEILKRGFDIYKTFLKFVSKDLNWGKLYNLARIKQPKDQEWINKKWYSEQIIQPIQDYLLRIPIVDLDNGKRTCIKDTSTSLLFPVASKREIREKLWELGIELQPDRLPKRSDIHEWHEIIWVDGVKLTLESLTRGIEKRLDVNKLADDLKKSHADTIAWLNNYYDLLNFEGKFIDEIVLGKYKVIPNQNLKFKSKLEIVADNKIDNEIKEVLKIFGIDLKESLLLNGVILKSNYLQEESKIVLNEKDQSSVIDQINKYIDSNHYNSSIAINYLISLFSSDISFPIRRHATYNFAMTLLPDVPEKKEIIYWSEAIWINADKVITDKMIKRVAECKNLSQLQILLKKPNFVETKLWLSLFIKHLIEGNFEQKLNLKNNPILPDQEGSFKPKDELFMDACSLDDGIKEIATELGYKIKSELLDKYFVIDIPENRSKTEQHIAEEISKLIKPVLRNDQARIEKKEVMRKLYLWMTRNQGIAKEIFTDIYEKRFLLVSDEEIAANIEKAEVLNEIIRKTNFSLKEIRDKFIDFINNPSIYQAEFHGGESLINDPNSVSEVNDLLRSKNITIDQLKQLILNIDADEDEMGISYSTSTHLSQKEKNAENEQARELVYEKLTHCLNPPNSWT